MRYLNRYFTLIALAALSMSALAATKASQPYTWRNVTIGGGGFVTGIVFNWKQPDLVYIRTDIGGAYRWNAGEKRWIPLLDWVGAAESNLIGVESIATDRTDANRVYLAVGTYTKAWSGNGAILSSTNQGMSWTRTDMPFKMGGNEDGRSMGERLIVDRNLPNILYYGSRHDGLWRSEDYAATWHKVESFPTSKEPNDNSIDFVVIDTHGSAENIGFPGKPTPLIYVGVSGSGTNLYQTTDAGATWQPVPDEPENIKTLVPHHGVVVSNSSLYVTFGNGPGPNGVTDGSVWQYHPKSSSEGTWTDITPVKPGKTDPHDRFGYAGLAADRNHPGTVMVSTLDRWNKGDDIFRTRDEGAHWISLKQKAILNSSSAPFLNWGRSSVSFGHWMGALALDPFDPNHVMYGTGATLWETDDVTDADTNGSTHWNPSIRGFEETAVLSLISPPEGAHLISGLGDIGGFRHDDLTVSPKAGIWTNPVMNNVDSLDFAAAKPAIIARVGHGGSGKGGAYSTDGATSWKPFPTEPSEEPKSFRQGNSIAVSADGHTFIWSAPLRAPQYSSDRGVTWTVCKGLPLDAAPISDRVNALKFYALDKTNGQLFVSSDGGATFSAATQASVTAGKELKGSLSTVPGHEGDLWISGGESGLYHSKNSGVKFTKVETVETARAIGFGKAAPGEKYPALYIIGSVNRIEGVFRSDDGGKAWLRINDDQHQYGWIGPITGDPRIYGRVYFGTNGRGIIYGDVAAKAK